MSTSNIHFCLVWFCHFKNLLRWIETLSSVSGSFSLNSMMSFAATIWHPSISHPAGEALDKLSGLINSGSDKFLRNFASESHSSSK